MRLYNARLWVTCIPNGGINLHFKHGGNVYVVPFDKDAAQPLIDEMQRCVGGKKLMPLKGPGAIG